MKTTNNSSNQGPSNGLSLKDYAKLRLESGSQHNNWLEKPNKPVSLSLNTRSLERDEFESNENIAAEARFLSLLQSDVTQEIPIPVKNSGTIQRQKTLKEEKEKSISTFKIEFKDLGEAEIQVSQSEDGYKVSIDVSDKSKIPANPLLFKKIVEDQLRASLGVDFKLKVR